MKQPFVELKHNTMPEKPIDCGGSPFLPVGFKQELESSQTIMIGETWFFVRVYNDAIHFESMKGEFLGLIKNRL